MPGATQQISRRRFCHGIGNPREPKNGRRYSGDLSHSLIPARLVPALRWRLDNQRYAQRRIVEKESVLLLPVISQRLPVIAGRYHQGSLVQPGVFQPFNQPAELLVRIGNLAVIGMICESAAERLRRMIRAVRVVEVQPQEEWLLGSLLQPSDRVRDTFFRLALDQVQLRLAVGLRRKRIIIEVEPAGEPPAVINSKRTDHRARGIAMLPQSLGDGSKARV